MSEWVITENAGLISLHNWTCKSDLTINELYEFFADEKNAQEWLEKVKLIGVQKALFDTPLDFLHYTSYKNSNFLYLSYKLNCCVTY